MKFSAVCFGLFAYFLIGCASTSPVNGNENSNDKATTEGEGKSLEEMREQAWAEIDQDACKAKGGDVRAEGMMGMPRCVTPYSDAGDICSSTSDCGGKCLGDDNVTDYNARAGEMKGVCAANDSPFGCYAEIIDGTATGFLCVD